MLTLVAMFRRRWSDIVGHTPFTLKRLAHAERLAVQLLAALGRRGKAPEAFLAAVHVRQQIFTLLVRTYEQARNAIRYLRRWKRDADSHRAVSVRGTPQEGGGERRHHSPGTCHRGDTASRGLRERRAECGTSSGEPRNVDSSCGS